MTAPDSNFLESAAGHLRQNNLAAAEGACRNALAATPDDPDALALLGDVCMRSGRTNRAVKQYRRAIDATRNGRRTVKPPLLVALGGALQANGDAHGALSALNEALEADPDFVDARFARAGLAWGMGNKARAIADLTVVVERQPSHVRAVSNLCARSAIWAPRCTKPAISPARLRQCGRWRRPANGMACCSIISGWR
jgi:tetratricopeptide (TPR) repeat protein